MSEQSKNPTEDQANDQVRRLCSQPAFDFEKRGDLLQFLVAREFNIRRKQEEQDKAKKPLPPLPRVSGAAIMLEFYVSIGENSPNDAPIVVADKGKKLADGLRKALQAHYREPANDDPIIFELKGGHRYNNRLIMTWRPERKDPQTPPRDAIRLAELFWQSHLDRTRNTLMVYGVPLFTRYADPKTQQTTYVRRINDNLPVDAEKSHSGEEYNWTFVTLGDMLAVIDLTKWLTNRGIPTALHETDAQEHLPAFLKKESWKDSAVVLGGTRINGVTKAYQRERLGPEGRHGRFTLPFRLKATNYGTVDRVVHVDDDDYKKEIGDPVLEEEYPQRVVPVVLTRRLGVRDGAITMITSHTGRATHRIAELLTDEDDLRRLFSDARLKSWIGAMPDTFQIVFSVPMFAQGAAAQSWRIERVWPEVAL